MKLPIQISFHNMIHSQAAEERIRKEAAKLNEFCDHILSCRVVVDVPHRHHQHGNSYQVRINITVPGKEIVVGRQREGELPSYQDINVAIWDAFDSAVRQLEDYVRRQRGDAKHHESPAYGKVTKLFPLQKYGFIETPDGRQIYFHNHSVFGHDLKDLRLGTEVTFVEELGDEGPQASTVRLVGKHHHIS